MQGSVVASSTHGGVSQRRPTKDALPSRASDTKRVISQRVLVRAQSKDFRLFRCAQPVGIPALQAGFVLADQTQPAGLGFGAFGAAIAEEISISNRQPRVCSFPGGTLNPGVARGRSTRSTDERLLS